MKHNQKAFTIVSKGVIDMQDIRVAISLNEFNMSKKISNLSDFLRSLEKVQSEHSGRHQLYRGHSRHDYELEPSVFRTKNWRKSEHLMLRQLLAENPKDFEIDQSAFDKLVRAQHYGLPTRLLDVSINPLVGLYFACCSNPSAHGKVLVISSPKPNHKYFDGDTVSLMSNLSFLKRSEKDELLNYAKENIKDDLNKEERIREYQNCRALGSLLQAVKAEKPHFEKRVDPFDLAFVASVTPKKSHDRIKAQEGQFLLFGLVEAGTGGHLLNVKVSEIEIPADSKSALSAELSQLGISRRTLFPEIENSAEQIKQRYS